MSETSAPLLAFVVAACCRTVITEITQQRRNTLDAIVASKKNSDTHGHLSLEVIEESLPDHELMIPQMIRVEEEQRLRAILELAETIEHVPGIRMEVSLHDFQFIKREYKKAAQK